MSIFFSFRIECREVTYVGKRICKSWNLPGERVLLGLLLGLFFLGGGLLGCLFFSVCGEADGRALAEYLVDYLTVYADASPLLGFGAAFWSEFRYGLAAVLLWWTSFGMVGYPVLFAVRGCLLTFSVGAFLHVFGLRGAIPACVLFLLPALLWSPGLFLIGTQGLCRMRLRAQPGEGPCSGVRPDELRVLMLAAVLFLLCGVLECVVLPQLISLTAEFVL